MNLCEWPLEDVGKVFKMTRVYCGARRVNEKSPPQFIFKLNDRSIPTLHTVQCLNDPALKKESGTHSLVITIVEMPV